MPYIAYSTYLDVSAEISSKTYKNITKRSIYQVVCTAEIITSLDGATQLLLLIAIRVSTYFCSPILKY